MIGTLSRENKKRTGQRLKPLKLQYLKVDKYEEPKDRKVCMCVCVLYNSHINTRIYICVYQYMYIYTESVEIPIFLY